MTGPVESARSRAGGSAVVAPSATAPRATRPRNSFRFSCMDLFLPAFGDPAPGPLKRAHIAAHGVVTDTLERLELDDSTQRLEFGGALFRRCEGHGLIIPAVNDVRRDLRQAFERLFRASGQHDGRGVPIRV